MRYWGTTTGGEQLRIFVCGLLSALILFSAGCKKEEQASAAAEAPPKAQVQQDDDASNFKLEHPERFPLATAGERSASPELNVTGTVSPDVSRQVPVVSMATGRVVEIDARLGDEVKQGQLLFKVRSSDIAGAYSDYRKALVNEQLTKVQLNRAQLLYDHGALPKSSLEVAQNAEDNAKVDLETTTEHLKLLDSDLSHPTGIVSVFAPVSGVISDQQITNAAGVQGLANPTSPFTISDLSHVWILCDVYENNLSQVQVGEYADVKLNAYPNRTWKARVANIGPILDPNLRTGKIRLEVENPGMVMKLGMFVTATFHGSHTEKHAVVPATAILHLHDRDWVYTPVGDGRFKRLEVVAGNTLPDNMQEVVRGELKPGMQVVANALVLQNTVEQ
jgi:cobalt-zinc-cadmium efflux system membrane fusion protein